MSLQQNKGNYKFQKNNITKKLHKILIGVVVFTAVAFVAPEAIAKIGYLATGCGPVIIAADTVDRWIEIAEKIIEMCGPAADIRP